MSEWYLWHPLASIRPRHYAEENINREGTVGKRLPEAAVKPAQKIGFVHPIVTCFVSRPFGPFASAKKGGFLCSGRLSKSLLIDDFPMRAGCRDSCRDIFVLAHVIEKFRTRLDARH